MSDPTGASAAAGWYPDPAGRADHRWWDGSSWTTTVADGSVTRHDLFGVPAAGPPRRPAAAGPPIGASAEPPPTRSPLVSVIIAALVGVLVIALLVLVHRGDDRAAADAKARSELSDHLAALSERNASLFRDQSSLSAHVDELSSSVFPEFTDFTDLTDLSSFGGADIDACSLLLPDEVSTVLGQPMHVDESHGFGGFCMLVTDQASGGIAVFVEAGSASDDLEAQLLEGAPGSIQDRPVTVGDEAYVADGFGLVVGIAAKGDRSVTIEVQSGAGQPTDDQMVLLLQAAVDRL